MVLVPETVPLASVVVEKLFWYNTVVNWAGAAPVVDNITFKSSSKSVVKVLYLNRSLWLGRAINVGEINQSVLAPFDPVNIDAIWSPIGPLPDWLVCQLRESPFKFNIFQQDSVVELASNVSKNGVGKGLQVVLNWNGPTHKLLNVALQTALT